MFYAHSFDMLNILNKIFVLSSCWIPVETTKSTTVYN